MPMFSDDPSSCVSPSPPSRSENMDWKVRGDMNRPLPVIAFFLGAALDVNWRFSEMAVWGNAARDEVSDLVTTSSDA